MSPYFLAYLGIGMKDLRGDLSQLQGNLGRVSSDFKRQMLATKSIQEDGGTHFCVDGEDPEESPGALHVYMFVCVCVCVRLLFEGCDHRALAHPHRVMQYRSGAVGH